MKFAMKTALAAMVVLAGSASVVNADAGSGTVTFNGKIIEAACSIAPESVDQIVPLGQVAKSQLESGGSGRPEPFYIKLTDCDAETLKTVTSTFTGAESADVPGALGIVGTARGAGIKMVDGSGVDIELGKATTPYTLPVGGGDATLSFAAYLQGALEDDKVVAGEFTSVTHFSLAYQ